MIRSSETCYHRGLKDQVEADDEGEEIHDHF